MTATITGDKQLDLFFRQVTPKLQRGALRKGVRAGGSALVKEIRRNIDTMVGKNRQSVRFDSRGKRTSLRRSIGQRAWSKPRAGIIGTVVGPRFPEGAHGHLIEFGHEVVSHGRRTGVRTQPIPFQRKAQRTASAAIVAAVRAKMQQALRTLRA